MSRQIRVDSRGWTGDSPPDDGWGRRHWMSPGLAGFLGGLLVGYPFHLLAHRYAVLWSGFPITDFNSATWPLLLAIIVTALLLLWRWRRPHRTLYAFVAGLLFMACVTIGQLGDFLVGLQSATPQGRSFWFVEGKRDAGFSGFSRRSHVEVLPTLYVRDRRRRREFGVPQSVFDKVVQGDSCIEALVLRGRGQHRFFRIARISSAGDGTGAAILGPASRKRCLSGAT